MNYIYRKIYTPALLALAVLTGGCAHTISVVPTEVVRSSNMPDRLKEVIGVYIPAEAIRLEVATPGGGGDSVKYFPYRDIELGFHKMLATVFQDVVQVSKINDKSEFERRGITYVISPVIITNSGSTNSTVWEPTNFSADLTSEIRDTSGKILYSPRVIGIGNSTAEFGIGVNRGIAGQLAIKDALQKMQLLLFDTLAPTKNLDSSNKSPTPPIKVNQ